MQCHVDSHLKRVYISTLQEKIPRATSLILSGPGSLADRFTKHILCLYRILSLDFDTEMRKCAITILGGLYFCSAAICYSNPANPVTSGSVFAVIHCSFSLAYKF